MSDATNISSGAQRSAKRVIPDPINRATANAAETNVTYIVPFRRWRRESLVEFATYLERLPPEVAIIVVDGSEPDLFAEHGAALPPRVLHVAIPAQARTPNGKVGGVTTGVAHARSERLVIADDDVRYDDNALAAIVARLDDAALARPQNYFEPAPWHAQWDSARSLLNRITGGDWPGTLALRRSAFEASGGYAGDVLFENFELERAIVRAGGRATLADDVFVRRLPPETRRFWEQRVRQAYDEFARPPRMLVFLTIAPLFIFALVKRAWKPLTVATLAATVLAEAGRRRHRADRYFAPAASLLAPLWLLERGVCCWLAVAARLRRGGIRYASSVLRDAASQQR